MAGIKSEKLRRKIFCHPERSEGSAGLSTKGKQLHSCD